LANVLHYSRTDSLFQASIYLQKENKQEKQQKPFQNNTSCMREGQCKEGDDNPSPCQAAKSQG